MILWATHLKSLATTHFSLEPGFYQLGRETPTDPSDKLSVPFDPKLSRRAVRIEVKRSRIVVQRDGSRSPLFFEQREQESFEMLPGQRFSVAETVFELVHEMAQTLTDDEVEQALKSPSEQLLQLMLRVPPLLREDISVAELGRRINQVLPSSQLALFQLDPLQSLGEVALVPSRSLAARALEEGDIVFHQWDGVEENAPTAPQNESWALVCPIDSAEEKLLLYGVGRGTCGEVERGGFCLLVQMLSDHFEARRSAALAREAEETRGALVQLIADPDPLVRRAAERALRIEEDQTPLRVLSFGEFAIYLRGERLDGDWGGKQLPLIFCLLASARGAVAEDTFIDILWPDKGARGRKNLVAALSRLRNHLRQGGLEGEVIVRNHSGYSLDEGLSMWHDYVEVEGLLDTVSRGVVSNKEADFLETGRRLALLCKEPYLEGYYFDWVVRRRTELERRLQEAYQTVAEVALALESYEDALDFALASLRLEPCCQESHLVCMNAYTGSGRPEQAVRQFEKCQRMLSSELDMEPSIALLTAHQRALLSIP